MRSLLIVTVFISCLIVETVATTLHVGIGQTYPDVSIASRSAMPGDTLLIHEGAYRGTFWIENLNGTDSAWIVIRGVNREAVRFEGGAESLHLSDCSFIRIENFTVTLQTGNGMNIDDAGTIETPTHHISLREISFLSMNATDNNDMLKLSGLDNFSIESCAFYEGSTGGSGIDMVGCHQGRIVQCQFQRMGSNAIQAKGGTQFLQILQNRFIDAGQRAINLGGSTGLQFFRPIDATFEAADIRVYANVFIRSVTPIAYVGSVRIDVANNTIIDPERWVFRILQETVDVSRFELCGNNIFRNNLIVMKSTLSTHVNIGANTAPETFLMTSNLWYMTDNIGRSRPTVPALTESRGIYGLPPLLVSASDFHLSSGSPAIGAGIFVDSLTSDYDGIAYTNPPSIGAFEWQNTSAVWDHSAPAQIALQRIADGWIVTVPPTRQSANISVYDLRGSLVRTLDLPPGTHDVKTSPYHFVIGN